MDTLFDFGLNREDTEAAFRIFSNPLLFICVTIEVRHFHHLLWFREPEPFRIIRPEKA